MSVSPPMLGSRWVAFVPKLLFHRIVPKVTPSFSAQTRKKLARSSVNSASPEGQRRTIFVNKDFFSSCYLKKVFCSRLGVQIIKFLEPVIKDSPETTRQNEEKNGWDLFFFWICFSYFLV